MCLTNKNLRLMRSGLRCVGKLRGSSFVLRRGDWMPQLFLVNDCTELSGMKRETNEATSKDVFGLRLDLWIGECMMALFTSRGVCYLYTGYQAS